MYLRTWSSVRPNFAFSQTHTPVSEASDSSIGWPFMSARLFTPASGWAMSTHGSFCMAAITAFTGTCSSARLSATKLLEPMPMSAAPDASSCGTLELGPPCRIVTSSPRFAYSPVARAS